MSLKFKDNLPYLLQQESKLISRLTGLTVALEGRSNTPNAKATIQDNHDDVLASLSLIRECISEYHAKVNTRVPELLDIVFPDNPSKTAFTRFANVISNDLVEQQLMAYLDLKSTGCMFSANSFEASIATHYSVTPALQLNNSFG